MENPLLIVLENVVAFMEHSNGPRKYARAAREALDEMKTYLSTPVGLESSQESQAVESPQDSAAELPPEAETPEAE